MDDGEWVAGPYYVRADVFRILLRDWGWDEEKARDALLRNGVICHNGLAMFVPM